MTHSIFNYGHIVKLYSHFVYSPLNSYVYIHWILDFKYILLLLYTHIDIHTLESIGYNNKSFNHNNMVNEHIGYRNMH